MARRRSSDWVALISIRFMMRFLHVSNHHRPMTGQRCRNERQKTKGIAAETVAAVLINVEISAEDGGWARG
ncbi:MAG: hypothetical protein ACOVKR_01945, partial [Limnohabitans sp.]